MDRPPPAVTDRFARWMTRRVRAAYTRVSGVASAAGGLAGAVEEMRWGLANLDPARRARADRAVFDAIFLGPVGIVAIRALARRAPDLTARLFARLTPTALGFLIGEAVYAPPVHDTLPACAFRASGGDALCEHVCRAPTEAFCRSTLLVPLRLAPDPASHACRWTWGRAADAPDAVDPHANDRARPERTDAR